MKLSKTDLISLLRTTADSIEHDDSMEGSLRYEDYGQDCFEVSAFLRIGNRNGQGGVRLIQPSREADAELNPWCNCEKPTIEGTGVCSKCGKRTL